MVDHLRFFLPSLTMGIILRLRNKAFIFLLTLATLLKNFDFQIYV